MLNAQVMNEMIRVESEMVSRHRKSGYSHPKEVWETVLGTCEKLRGMYQHTLPSNAAVFVKSLLHIRNMGMKSWSAARTEIRIPARSDQWKGVCC